MKTTRDCNPVRIIHTVEMRLTNRARRNDKSLLDVCENEMERKVAEYLIDRENKREQLFEYINTNYIEEEK